MTSYFLCFSTVIQSYQDNERLIARSCVPSNPVYDWIGWLVWGLTAL